MNNDMNYDEITVGDCLEQFEYKNETVLLNDGKVAGFVKNEEKNSKNEKENSCYRFSNGVASITSDNK